MLAGDGGILLHASLLLGIKVWCGRRCWAAVDRRRGADSHDSEMLKIFVFKNENFNDVGLLNLFVNECWICEWKSCRMLRIFCEFFSVANE